MCPCVNTVLICVRQNLCCLAWRVLIWFFRFLNTTILVQGCLKWCIEFIRCMTMVDNFVHVRYASCPPNSALELRMPLALWFLHNPRILFKIRAVPLLQGPSSINMLPLKLFFRYQSWISPIYDHRLHWCILGFSLKPWQEAKQLDWFCHVWGILQLHDRQPTYHTSAETTNTRIYFGNKTICVGGVSTICFIEIASILESMITLSECLVVHVYKMMGLIKMFFPTATIPNKLN